MSKLVTAEEFCKLTEEGCAKFNTLYKITKETNLDEFPWDYELSDHLPVYFDDGKSGFKIMSFNVNNPKFSRHLSRSTHHGEQEDISQRISESNLAKKALDDGRLHALAVFILHRVMQGFVVCLQEVGNGLHTKLREIVNQSYGSYAFHIRDSEFKCNSGERMYDCNSVLFDMFRYTLVEVSAMVLTEANLINNHLDVLTLKSTENEKMLIKLANVHVKFRYNHKYARAFAAAASDLTVPLFVCGDFNCSSRYPKRPHDPADHLMDHYSDPNFAFARHAPHVLQYSHVGRFDNAKSTYNQLDCIDYIMVVRPDLLTF